MAAGPTPTVDRASRDDGAAGASADLHDAALVGSVLQSDESLRWTGKPGRLWMLAFRNSWQHFLGTFLILVFFAWPPRHLSLIPRLQAGDFDSVVTGGFLALALFGAVSPIFQYISARCTTYAITNLRAIILIRFPWRRVQSFYRAHIEIIEKKAHGDGKLSLTFRTEIRSGGEATTTRRYGFYYLQDGNVAEQWLQRIVADAK